MKIVFLLLLFSQYHLISSGQNKNDTEKWLSYNLNKYFDGDEYGITTYLDKARLLAKEKGGFVDWGVRQYSFEGKNLIIRITWYKIDTSMHVNKNVVYSLDLSKLLKIRQETDTRLYMYSTKLIFEFQRKLDNGNYPYKGYDEINHKDIIIHNFDYTISKMEAGNYKEEVSSDRFVKAFTRLAELNGADVIKDVY